MICAHKSPPGLPLLLTTNVRFQLISCIWMSSKVQHTATGGANQQPFGRSALCERFCGFLLPGMPLGRFAWLTWAEKLILEWDLRHRWG